MPKRLCTDDPTIDTTDYKTGVVYRTPTGAPVRYEGIKSVEDNPHGGIRFVRHGSGCSDNSKALMSVSEMVDAGHQAIFD